MKPLLLGARSGTERVLRLGLLVNPVAGLGGPLGYKGSDALPEAAVKAATPRAEERAAQTLAALASYRDELELITLGGHMGELAAATRQ